MAKVKAKADESEGEKAALQDHIKTLKVRFTVNYHADRTFTLYLPPRKISGIFNSRGLFHLVDIF